MDRTLAAAILAVACVVAAGEAQGPTEAPAIAGTPIPPPPSARVALDRSFSAFEVFRLDLPTFERLVREKGRVLLELGRSRFDLALWPHDVRAPGHRSERTGREGRLLADPRPTPTFRGHVAGAADSEVRLLVLPDLLQGYIRVGTVWNFIDPVARFARGRPGSEVVLYQDANVKKEALGTCGTDALMRVIPDAVRPPRLAPAPQVGSAPLQVQVAADADFEYYQIYGANTDSQIQGVVNQVSGVYSSELGFPLVLAYQHAYTDANQPYLSSDAGTLLAQFKNNWNQNFPSVVRDMAHLFTGKDVSKDNDSGTVGLAYVGVVWASPRSAYGLSEDNSLMAKLVSHEMGHNFGAEHICSSCSCSDCLWSTGTIMCPCLQSTGPTDFSDFSVCQIATFVNLHGP